MRDVSVVLIQLLIQLPRQLAMVMPRRTLTVDALHLLMGAPTRVQTRFGMYLSMRVAR